MNNQHNTYRFNSYHIAKALPFLSILFFCFNAVAAPYIPESPGTIIATWGSTKNKELEQNDSSLIERGLDLLEHAQEPGQSSLYLQTQELLKPLVEAQSSDARVWLAWARLQKQNNNFSDAKSALNKALELDLKNQDAYLLLADVYILEQNYGQASKACDQAAEYFDSKASKVCVLNALSYQGQLEKSYTELKTLLESQPFIDQRRIWAGLILANMAVRLELWDINEQWLDNSVTNNNLTSLIKWSDGKLKQDKPEQVLEKLTALTQPNISLDNALLLRLAQAEKTLNASASIWEEKLNQNIASREQSSDVYYADDLATYYLDFAPNAQEALVWATLNSQHAKENKDRALLERARQTAEKVGG